MPKSPIFTSPSRVYMTFWGFTSRWMTPFRCAAERPAERLVDGVERDLPREAPRGLLERVELAAVDVLHDDVGVRGVGAAVERARRCSGASARSGSGSRGRSARGNRRRRRRAAGSSSARRDGRSARRRRGRSPPSRPARGGARGGSGRSGRAGRPPAARGTSGRSYGGALRLHSAPCRAPPPSPSSTSASRSTRTFRRSGSSPAGTRPGGASSRSGTATPRRAPSTGRGRCSSPRGTGARARSPSLAPRGSGRPPEGRRGTAGPARGDRPRLPLAPRRRGPGSASGWSSVRSATTRNSPAGRAPFPDLVRELDDAGLVVVGAAGWDPEGHCVSPASSPHALGVGGWDLERDAPAARASRRAPRRAS